jgi:DNA-binding response OmpR family regulator
MALDPASRGRFNLSQTVVLLLDATSMGMSILVQIVTGLGAKNLYRCSTVAEAQEIASNYEIDLAIVDASPLTGGTYEFVRWLRHEFKEGNRYTPIVLTAGHTMRSDVAKSRDCGGNIMIAKPIAPITMLERIIWVAKGDRPFLVTDTYCGPDRRFNVEKPTEDTPRRRREDKQEPTAVPAVAAGTIPEKSVA